MGTAISHAYSAVPSRPSPFSSVQIMMIIILSLLFLFLAYTIIISDGTFNVSNGACEDQVCLPQMNKDDFSSILKWTFQVGNIRGNFSAITRNNILHNHFLSLAGLDLPCCR